MPRANKTRRLWLNIKVSVLQPKIALFILELRLSGFDTKDISAITGLTSSQIKQSSQKRTKSDIKAALIASIAGGGYQLPPWLKARIQWRNKEAAPMREGEWTEEMMASAQSSPGFDLAVMSYLDRW